MRARLQGRARRGHLAGGGDRAAAAPPLGDNFPFVGQRHRRTLGRDLIVGALWGLAIGVPLVLLRTHFFGGPIW